MPEIAGVVAFREPQKGVQEPLVAVGAHELTYQTQTLRLPSQRRSVLPNQPFSHR